MIRRPPRSTRTDTLFPYTTLFRSHGVEHGILAVIAPEEEVIREVQPAAEAGDMDRPVLLQHGVAEVGARNLLDGGLDADLGQALLQQHGFRLGSGRIAEIDRDGADRKSVVWGKNESVRVDQGGGRTIKTTKKNITKEM